MKRYRVKTDTKGVSWDSKTKSDFDIVDVKDSNQFVFTIRGYRSREEELELFHEHSSRYDGESINLQGEYVTSKPELEFREKAINEINKFWDEFVSPKQTDYII